MKKSCRKCVPKSSTRRLSNLLNNLKQSLPAKTFLKIVYFERGLLKSLDKDNFIFSFEPSPF